MTTAPRPEKLQPLPDSFARVCDDGYWVLRVAGTDVFAEHDSRQPIAQEVYSEDQLRAYGREVEEQANNGSMAVLTRWQGIYGSAEILGYSEPEREVMRLMIDELREALAASEPGEPVACPLCSFPVSAVVPTTMTIETLAIGMVRAVIIGLRMDKYRDSKKVADELEQAICLIPPVAAQVSEAEAWEAAFAGHHYGREETANARHWFMAGFNALRNRHGE